MKAPTNLRDIPGFAAELIAKLAEVDEKLELLDRRLEEVEAGRDYMVDWEPPIIPPFPHELREIGLRPPRER